MLPHIGRANKDKFEKQNRVGQLTASIRGTKRVSTKQWNLFILCGNRLQRTNY